MIAVIKRGLEHCDHGHDRSPKKRTRVHCDHVLVLKKCLIFEVCEDYDHKMPYFSVSSHRTHREHEQKRDLQEGRSQKNYKDSLFQIFTVA